MENSLREVIREALESGDYTYSDIVDIVDEIDDDIAEEEEMDEMILEGARDEIINALINYVEVLSGHIFDEESEEELYDDLYNQLTDMEDILTDLCERIVNDMEDEDDDDSDDDGEKLISKSEFLDIFKKIIGE